MDQHTQWWSTDHTLITMIGLPEGPHCPTTSPCGILLPQVAFLMRGWLCLDVNDFIVQSPRLTPGFTDTNFIFGC